MLNCYIVDDEQNAVDALAAMLKKKFALQVKICGSNIKASVAIEEIEQYNEWAGIIKTFS